MYPLVNDEVQISDPLLKALTLRAQAAEQAVEAAKLYCKITHLEMMAANFALQKLKHQESAVNITTRGQYFYDRMKEQQSVLEKQKGPKDILAAEVARNREKAMKLSAQASAHEKKMERAEQKTRAAHSEAEKLKHERDRCLIEARKLEAEATRIQSLI